MSFTIQSKKNLGRSMNQLKAEPKLNGKEWRVEFIFIIIRQGDDYVSLQILNGKNANFLFVEPSSAINMFNGRADRVPKLWLKKILRKG